MDIKVCNKCGISKTLDNFEFRKDGNFYRNTCKECISKVQKERYNDNKDLINKKRREKYNLNKDKINEIRRSKIKDLTPIQRLREQVRRAICKSYERKGFVRTKSVEEILGRSLDEEIEFLVNVYEKKYKRKYDGTEKVCVDHVIPIWTAKNTEELDKCNRCLQLLSEEENHRKGGKFANGIGKNGKVKYTYIPFDYFN